jgi:uncharacterized protein YciI
MRRWFGRQTMLLLIVAYGGTALAQSDRSTGKYFLVLLRRPSSSPQLSKENADRLQEEHMENIRKMYAEHKLVIAGPFIDDTSLRGIFVLRADAIAQAQEWANSDPAIKAGRLAAEIRGPWLIETAAIHQPANPEGMDKYTFVLLKSVDRWNPGSPTFMTLMNGHSAFLKKMTDDGSVAVAGDFPFDDANSLRGAAIFRVGEQQADKIVEQDPTVKAGLLKPEIHPWITGKGVLAPGMPMQ